MIKLDQDTLKHAFGTIVAALIIGGSIIWLGLTQRFTGVYSGVDNIIFVVDGLTGSMRRCLATNTKDGGVLYVCNREDDYKKFQLRIRDIEFERQ
jgi:hypothetical protein